MLTVPQTVRMHRTNLQTSSTADAFFLEELNLRLHSNGLGIVTPTASHATALEEHRGTDARAIMRGESLYVKDGSIHASILPLHCFRATDTH